MGLALVARAQQIFAVVPMLKEGTLFVYCTYGISHNDFCLCAVGTNTIRCQVVDKTLNCSLLGFDVWLVGAKGFNIVVYVLYGFYLFVLTSQSFRHYCSFSNSSGTILLWAKARLLAIALFLRW